MDFTELIGRNNDLLDCNDFLLITFCIFFPPKNFISELERQFLGPHDSTTVQPYSWTQVALKHRHALFKIYDKNAKKKKN